MLLSRLAFWGIFALWPIPLQVISGHISLPQHRTMRFHRLRPDNTVDSENWSGYAVTGSTYTQALGSWVVPAGNCNVTPNTYSSYWVGLDGYSSSTVEQIGTDSDCNGGAPSYYAWYEFYPRGSVYIGSLSPGDRISAAISFAGGEFTVTILDETNGESYRKSAKVPEAQRSSAEWIAEAPCCTRAGATLPLSDFSAVSLGDDYTGAIGTNYAVGASTSGPIGAFGSSVQEIVMAGSNGAEEAVPLPLTPDGTSFMVTWKSE